MIRGLLSDEARNLTLVTNNAADFKNILGLRLDDWLTP
jgi:predicted nucleic acid-binding protein